jgi:quinol monooxygenase YgiN
MIIVAGFLRLDPDQRTSYLDGCEGVIRAARSAPGCIDFHLSADPIEADRINIFEQWDSAESVDAFRGSGPSDEQQATITEANVVQHEIAGSSSLT